MDENQCYDKNNKKLVNDVIDSIKVSENCQLTIKEHGFEDGPKTSWWYGSDENDYEIYDGNKDSSKQLIYNPELKNDVTSASCVCDLDN